MTSKDKDSELSQRQRSERKDKDSELSQRHRSERKEKDKDKDREKKKERDKDRDREKDRDKDSASPRERRHHKSSKPSKSKPSADGETSSRSHRRHRTMDLDDPPRDGSDDGAGTTLSERVPGLSTRLSTDRVSMPYPTFSKAHSKEFVHSKEDISTPAARRTDPLTPEPTDLGSTDMKRSQSADETRKSSSSSKRTSSAAKSRPPTPPETDLASEKSKRRSGTPSSVKEDAREDRPRSRSSWVSGSTSKNELKSKVSKASSQATFVKSPTVIPPSFGILRAAGSGSGDGRSSVASTEPRRTPSTYNYKPPPPPLETDSSPESAADSSPKTPTQTLRFPPSAGRNKVQTMFDATGVDTLPLRPATNAPGSGPSMGGPPPPPPPPPPPLSIQEAPRVDYLMQYGGLPQAVPRSLLSVLPRQNGTRPSNPPLQGAETIFAPFYNLLNQYQTVLSGNGSMAVATGHQTIARRLLDRLENVFSRDLSPNGCSCVMCERSERIPKGLSWGEVLERVSGRVDLPQWPPFDLASLGTRAAEDAAGAVPRPDSPIAVDPDIAEEWRDHYLRQTKKARTVVDKWMTNCDQALAPLPPEIDDETLTFAVLTTLDSDDRPYFNALLSGSRELQYANRAPTPMRKPRNDLIVKGGLSLQRLYRLPQAPRDAETTAYLVRNPNFHDLLYTISDIHPSEWEILTSGRFDGFLWSGADDDFPPHLDSVSRGATPASGLFPLLRSPSVGRAMSSRNPTPFSRGATPASFVSVGSMASSAYPNRTAVSHDEEAEVAVLAEVERELFAGMESLEDAFEKLHSKAEAVREALRQRSAGLSMSLQRRRTHGIDVLPLSGSSGVNDRPTWGNDEDSVVSESDWAPDEMSELAPDDSASNISSSRHRRPRRRKERNTPAPIEEE